jgi:hypothetical protein
MKIMHTMANMATVSERALYVRRPAASSAAKWQQSEQAVVDDFVARAVLVGCPAPGQRLRVLASGGFQDAEFLG